MNTFRNLHLVTGALCISLMFNTGCKNDSPSQDSKEHAEEMNDENLERDTEKDADRMLKLQASNLFEIQASQSAASKATTAEVKKLAAMMVEAHTKMGADMQAHASSKSITLPADISNEHKRELDGLNEKTGIDFDKQYLDEMEGEHEDAVKTLENISDKSEDADTKSWAAKNLPEIRSHLDMIKSTKETIKDMKDNDKNNNKKDDHDGHNH